MTDDAGVALSTDAAAPRDAARPVDAATVVDAIARVDAPLPEDAALLPDAAPSDAWSCGSPASLPVLLLATETMRTTTQRTDLRIETTEWETTPTIIAESSTWLRRDAGNPFALAHDLTATANWWVDNFVLFEVFDCDGHRLDAAYAGFTNDELVYLDGVRVRELGRQSFEFTPREITLESLVPAGTLVHLRATALDYGSWVSLGDLWILP